MPRNLQKEITDLKMGLHQFIMTMYGSIEKLVEEKEAKSQVIKVLQEQIDYIRSTNGDFQEEPSNAIKALEKERNLILNKLKTEKDDTKVYELSRTLDELSSIIRYFNDK